MLVNLVTVVACIGLSIIAFYFIVTNLSLLSQGIETDGIIDVTGRGASKSTDAALTAQQQLEQYGQRLVGQGQTVTQELKAYLAQQQMRFKPKPPPAPEAKDSLLSGILKSVTPVSQVMPSAPDLETCDDYAPTETPITTNLQPILSTNEVVPNYLELDKEAYLSRSTPLAINEFNTHRPANFLSERTAPYYDKVSGQNLSYFFQNNPFKPFDELSKADVTDPAEWDRIAKQKESSSPLLSLSCMQQDRTGFMPSNHYETDKKYSGLC